MVVSIFQVLSDVFLKMSWLSYSVKRLVEDCLGFSMDTKIGGSIHFFIYDVIKIFILLSALIFLISYIQSYFPPERTKKILGRIKGIKGNIMGALLGTITPFCSCSSIPLFIGFTSAGLPVGVTFSFLISSPLVDLASFVLLTSFFGLKVALAYVVVGLILAVVGGTIIDKLKMEEQIEEFVKQTNDMDFEYEDMTKKQRLAYSRDQVFEIIKRVWIYIILGVGIGAAIHNWIPQDLVSNIVGENNPFAVLLATLIGIPMYADIFGTIPIAEALIMKNVPVGTVLTFMMAVTALSMPSIIMISKVVKRKLLYTFVGIVTIGIIIIGYLFNAVSYIFI